MSAISPKLQEIIELFSEASPHDRLDYLLEYSSSLPDLPPALAGQSLEQVHECATPIFLQARLENGQVYYDIDVPCEAPTVRGFAGILHQGLNGTTPTQILATPSNIYELLGLHKVLSSQRLRGLTALLAYMKRHAQRLSLSQA